MPRMNRVAVGNTVYHVINRANGRATIFHTEDDYRHFESLLEEAKELTDMRILAYAIMPNHWHLILYPKKDTDMSSFMRWLTTTHVRQTRVLTESIGDGHLYQGTYKSFPIEEDKHLIDVIRYVEQNPLRAKLVKRAEDWQWGSLYRRTKGTAKAKKLLAHLPTMLPRNYLASVNTVFPKAEIEGIRHSVVKGTPYGSPRWTDDMVEEYHLEGTLRGPGRPKKETY